MGAYARVLLPLLLIFSLVQISVCEIASSEIVEDNRAIILFSTFGFSGNGRVSINVSDVKVSMLDSTKKANKLLLGFFLTSDQAESKLVSDLMNGQCVLDDPYVRTLFTLHDWDVKKDNATGVYEFDYEVPDAQEYNLFFANCLPYSVVSMSVQHSVYNLENGKPDFLPAGKTPLPVLYFAFFLAYIAAFALWVHTCYARKPFVNNIHWLMACLVILKALTLLSQAGEYAYIKSAGAPHGWNIVYYIFTLFRGIMLFTVIVLIGTGWSLLKPFLQDREKNIIMIVIPLQVLANLTTIVLDETGPSSREFFTWRDIFHLIDIACCCAILFPIVWSIRQLREASQTDGKAARSLVKLSLFRQFYVTVVAYIYFTRIIVYLLQNTTPYRLAWTAAMAEEVVTLAFYLYTGYLFRPVEHNPYLHLDDDEEDAAAQILKDDDFEL